MALMAKAGGDYTPVPAGTHIGICVAVIDLGSQENPFKAGDLKRKVLVMWELPKVMIDTEDGPKPMSISKTYTLSSNPKSNLRKDLESWLGRALTAQEADDGYDVLLLAGMAAQVQVIHATNKTGKTYAKVNNIMGIPVGMDVPETSREPVTYEVEEGEESIPEWLPEWIVNQIKSSKELSF